MTISLRRWCAVLLATLIPLALLALPAPVTAAATDLRLIPALRTWTPATGSYTFTAASRIVRDKRYSSLVPMTDALAADLDVVFGRPVARVAGSTADLRPGDVYVGITTTDSTPGREAYTLTVTDTLQVRARNQPGAFYGTRTLVQLLRQSAAVPRGSGRDWPVKPERGLMVDVGRKYFTPGWIKKQIEEMAYLKLNTLHLHLSDNEGFRIESTSHPEVVSKSGFLTKAQVKDILAFAARNYVTVIPEIDAPGHLKAVLAQHPDLKANGSDTFIDVSKDAARRLLKDLYTEYLDLFPGPYFHLGADEYGVNYSQNPQLLAYARAKYGADATAKDAFYDFVNWANGVVRAAGRTARMWNDGIRDGDGTVAPDSNIVVEVWTRGAVTTPGLVARGHSVLNAGWNDTYYVLGNGRFKADPARSYEQYGADRFEDGTTLDSSRAAKNLGVIAHVWSDEPDAETEDQVRAHIADLLRVIAQQSWDSPKTAATYADFRTLITAVGSDPSAFGIDLARGRPVEVTSTETSAFPGSLAVDGDPATRWSSAYADPQSITVDLGATRTIGRVRLTWETAYARAYAVQVSADKTTWTTLSSTTAGDGGLDELGGLNGTGRYLRILGTQRGTGWGYSLYGVEAYVK